MSSVPETPEGSPPPPAFNPSLPLAGDFEVRLLQGLIKRLLQRVEDPGVELSVAEMQLIRQLCESNSVSFSSIKRGDFGAVAKEVAEEFPFDDEGRVVAIGTKRG